VSSVPQGRGGVRMFVRLSARLRACVRACRSVFKMARLNGGADVLIMSSVP
jgi:hypothetical protein